MPQFKPLWQVRCHHGMAPLGSPPRTLPHESYRRMPKLEIEQFPCLSDNYAVLIHDAESGLTASIDAPDAKAILERLDAKGWRLTHVLNTHHHGDHTGGNGIFRPIAKSIVPDGRVNIPDEVRRYKSLTLGGRVGWEPPYFHNRKLRDRLRRVACPTLLLWGEHDRFVPLANGRAMAESIPGAVLRTLSAAGHGAWIEQPRECFDIIAPFLAGGVAKVA